MKKNYWLLLLSLLILTVYSQEIVLKKAKVKTEWVQVGNEIPGGMLWPDGSTDNWIQLGKLLNKGYDAVKAVDKSIKVIVHLDEGDNIEKYRTFYDNATGQKVRYDVIGLSYYPFWVKIWIHSAHIF